MWIRLAYSPTARSYKAIMAPTDLGVTSSTVNVIDSLLFEYSADLVPLKNQNQADKQDVRQDDDK